MTTDTAPATTETETSDTAPPVTESAGTPAKAPKLPTLATKGKFAYFAAEDYVIVGHDTDAPGPESHRLLHILHQPQRLIGIKQKGTADLQATVAESGGTINNPVEYIEFKLDGEVEKLIVTGRRRVLTGRALGIPVPGIKLDPNDPNLWKRIRSENSARAEPSAMEVAADVAVMLAGDKTMNIEPMDFEAAGRVFGMNHQWARGMAKLNDASPAVQKAVHDGVLSTTHAYEISMEKTHEDQDKLLVACLEQDMTVAALKARRAAKKAGGAADGDGAAGDGEVKAATVHSTTWMRDVLIGLDAKLVEIHEADAALDSDPKAKVSCNALDQPTGAIDDLDTQRSKVLAVYNTVRAYLGEEEFGAVEGDDKNLDPGGESQGLWLLAVNANVGGEATRKRLLAEAKAEADKEATEKKQKAAEERETKKKEREAKKAAALADVEAKKQAALAEARAKDAAKAGTAAGTPGPSAV